MKTFKKYIIGAGATLTLVLFFSTATFAHGNDGTALQRQDNRYSNYGMESMMGGYGVMTRGCPMWN